MKFLVDSCVGRRLSDWLVDQGHDVVFADSIGTDPGDNRLLEMATVEGRVVVTIDMDFGELVFLHGASHAGLVRLPDVPVVERIALMERVLEMCREALSQQAIVTVSTRRIRVSTGRG